VRTDWLLELGHSRLKLARRAGEGLAGVQSFPLEHFGEWLAGQAPAPDDRFWLSSVPLPEVTARVSDVLARAGLEWTAVTTGSTALPVAASYSGMGVDRWLAIQPVWTALRAPFCLVDCGTATTIDVVDGLGVHRGGWIMPGLDAAREGLLARAPGLRRELPEHGALPLPARDTAQGIEDGLLLQQAGGIALAFRIGARVPDLGGEPALVMTGGAAGPLQSFFEGARVEPDLVLRGLAMAVESLSMQ
jgi:type III pantothenate kinase